MKLTKVERDLLKNLGRRGGLAAQERRTLEEKQLYSQKMNDAKRLKRLRMLTGRSASDNTGDIKQVSEDDYERERLPNGVRGDDSYQLRDGPAA